MAVSGVQVYMDNAVAVLLVRQVAALNALSYSVLGDT
jgi:hypothetical protein